MQKDRQLLRLNELRGLAIMGVVLIHVSATYLFAAQHHATFVILLTINQWARFCVPLFFMMSGMVFYYNYGEGKINYFAFVIKRLRYIVIPYLLWAIIYGYIRHLGFDGGGIQTFKDWVIDVSNGRISYHLYFIAVIIQLYVIFPLLRPLLRPPYAVFTLLLSLLIYIGQTISLWMHLRGEIIWPAWYQLLLNNNNIVSWWLFYFVLGTRLSQIWPTWELLKEKSLTDGPHNTNDQKLNKSSYKNSIFFFLLLIILSGILYWMAYQAHHNWPEGFIFFAI